METFNYYPILYNEHVVLKYSSVGLLAQLVEYHMSTAEVMGLAPPVNPKLFSGFLFITAEELCFKH